MPYLLFGLSYQNKNEREKNKFGIGLKVEGRNLTELNGFSFHVWWCDKFKVVDPSFNVVAFYFTVNWTLQLKSKLKISQILRLVTGWHCPNKIYKNIYGVLFSNLRKIYFIIYCCVGEIEFMNCMNLSEYTILLAHAIFPGSSTPTV